MTHLSISEYLPELNSREYLFVNPYDPSDRYSVVYSVSNDILECKLFAYGALSISQKIEVHEFSADIISTKFHHPDGADFESFERSILIPENSSCAGFRSEILEDESLAVDKLHTDGHIQRREIYSKGVWLCHITSYTNSNFESFTMRLEDITSVV